MSRCTECANEVLARSLCRTHYQRKVAAAREWHPCECGCGESTQGPRFVPGHNVRLLSSEEQGRRGRMNDGSTQRDRGRGHTYRKMRGVHEHRVVAEKMLGRRLTRSEIVHHRNGNVRDNRPANLEVMSRADHARLHFFGR